MKIQVLLFVFLHVNNSKSLIVPDEIPTLLSLIYSNIPTLKKGTDSRLGWGFRLGDRADFQVLVELGPQQNTQPLANQGSSSNKRNVPVNLVSTLYAQRQKDKNQISNTDGGKFIEEWSKDMALRNEGASADLGLSKVPLRIGEIDAKKVIPDDASEKAPTTTFRKDDLDDVSLDDE